MDKLVSSWFTTVQSLPEDYVFPVEQRPGEEFSTPIPTAIPVIDLGKANHDRQSSIQQILKASQEFGFFQVINHGVSANLMDETLGVFKEFFTMPDINKASGYSEDPSKSCRLYTSSNNYATEKVHLWRDNLKHPCHPLDDCMHLWPEKPTRYRDVVGRYSVEVTNLSMQVVELISEGLGLQQGFFEDELTGVQLLSVNHYPPCPNPSLALGLSKHCDPCLLTILLQGTVYGLQVFKDGKWIGVEPIPNAFVVNIGYQLQIISNGRLKSAKHRVVTNSRDTRTTIATFIGPSNRSIVEPAKALIDDGNPPLYKSFPYVEFLKNYIARSGDADVLEAYKVKQ